MTKLIVTADLHGSYASWLTIKNLLNPSDTLAIAGDLFDTKYGNYSNTDFQPGSIKNDINKLKQKIFYVYGNCDTPSFYPGFNHTMKFAIFNKKILLSHGHRSLKFSEGIDIAIQGHTHLCSLEKKGHRILMNPGSITYPRNGIYTYGIIKKTSASLVELKTGDSIFSIDF